MKRLALTISVFATLLPCLNAGAQENEFSVDAQLRGRGEYRAGLLDPYATNLNPSAFINERARIGINYKNSWLSLRVAGQHTGVWGQTAQNPVNTGDFNINEAWAQISFGSCYFKLGRQTLVYDDERIFGDLDWHVSGRSHDVIKFGFVSNDKIHRFDIMGAFNQNTPKVSGGTYYTPSGQPYKTMLAGWYHADIPLDIPLGVSLLAMNLGFENGTSAKPSQRFLQTFGTYITYNPGIFNLEGSFYYQTGKSAADRVVGAWMFALKGTARINSMFSAGAGLDWLSGNTTGEMYTAFDPLYGTHHKFYGLIDYWYVNRGASAPNYGLIDPYVNVEVNACKNLNLSLAGHFFLNDSNAGVKAYTAKQYKATEVDFQVAWKIKDCLTLMGGWSGFFGSDKFYYEYEVLNQTITNPGRNQNWVWLQLNVNPRIFFTKW